MHFVEDTRIHNVISVSISGALTAALGDTECMHTCPLLLGVVVCSNALLYVSLFLLLTDLRQFSPCELAGHSPRPQKGYGRQGPWGGGKQASLPSRCLNKETLQAEDSMRNGYCPKMLLYALDELFYVYAQVKNSQRPDKKLVLAYEILCISTNCCTNRRNRIRRLACLMP